MNNDLKQFMEKTFPTGTKIKIDRAANDDIVGKKYIMDRIDDNGLYCSTESGNVVLIDPDESTFYKLDQPPIVAYGCDDEPAELTDVRKISEFIINNGLYGDITMYKKDTGEFVLSTIGIFIYQIADMDFRNELLTILVPLQQQFPFGMPDTVTMKAKSIHAIKIVFAFFLPGQHHTLLSKSCPKCFHA